MRNVIYYNSKCSKSRTVLAILEEKNIDIEVFEYLKDPIDIQELSFIVEKMNYDWSVIIRSKEERFKELGLSLEDAKKPEEWVKILRDNPTLLERPIVAYNDNVGICRPTENIFAIINSKA